MKEETTDQGHEAKIEAEVEYLTQTPLESEEIAALPQAHKDYLLSRHGTLDLDPIPDMIDADPYNWPQWKVHIFYFVKVVQKRRPRKSQTSFL